MIVHSEVHDKARILRCLTALNYILFALLVFLEYKIYFSEDFISSFTLFLAPVLLIGYDLSLIFFGFYKRHEHITFQDIESLYWNILSMTLIINVLFLLSFILFFSAYSKEYHAERTAPLNTVMELDLVQQSVLEYSCTELSNQVTLAGSETQSLFDLRETSKSDYTDLVEKGLLPEFLDRTNISISKDSTDIFADRPINVGFRLRRYVYVYEIKTKFPVQTQCSYDDGFACIDLDIYYRAKGYLAENENIVTVVADVPADVEISDEVQVRSVMFDHILNRSSLDVNSLPLDRVSRLLFYFIAFLIFVLTGTVFVLLSSESFPF